MYVENYMLPQELANLLTIFAIVYGICWFVYSCKRVTNLSELKTALDMDRWIWVDGLSANVSEVQVLTRPHLERLLRNVQQNPKVLVDQLKVEILFEKAIYLSKENVVRLFFQSDHEVSIHLCIVSEQLREKDQLVFELINEIHSETEIAEKETVFSSSGFISGRELNDGQQDIPVPNLLLDDGSVDGFMVVFIFRDDSLPVQAFQLDVEETSSLEEPEQKLSMGFERIYLATAHEVYDVKEIFGEENISVATKSLPECVICYAEEQNVVLLPCRHLAVCANCFPHLDKCPNCRCTIEGSMVYVIEEPEE